MDTFQPRQPDQHTGADVGRFSNVQICAFSLWTLGGASMPQDLEDVTAKCFELAPARFSWKKHPYPNLETAWAAMRHDGKGGEAPLVRGSKRIGWLLTTAGIEWVKDKQHMFPADAIGRASVVLRRGQAATLKALGSHDAFTKWTTGAGPLRIYEIADSVQLTADAPKTIIAQRIDELSNIAHMGSLTEMLRFLEWLKMQLEEAY